MENKDGIKLAEMLCHWAGRQEEVYREDALNIAFGAIKNLDDIQHALHRARFAKILKLNIKEYMKCYDTWKMNLMLGSFIRLYLQP